MKVTLGGCECLVEREANDPPIKDESHLLYQVKKVLQAQGFDVVKKPMWKDGHLVSGDQRYVRTRDWGFCVWDGAFDIHNSAQEYNRDGKFTFGVERRDTW